jgi:DNA-binding MarR family transcriptional regulator
MKPKATSGREEIGEEIASLLGPLVRSIRATLVECAGELGLALSDAQALWVLETRDSVSTKELARALDIDPANASTLITRLEARKLVRRTAAKDDRRKRLISITPRGRQTRARIAACIGERRPSFSALTTAELAIFRDLLRRVVDVQSAPQSGPSPDS